MNIDELKKLVKHSTAVLVLDGGEPSFAILSYDMYKNLVLADKDDKELNKELKVSHSSSNTSPIREKNTLNLEQGELEILERINKDILALKQQIEEEEKGID